MFSDCFLCLVALGDIWDRMSYACYLSNSPCQLGRRCPNPQCLFVGHPLLTDRGGVYEATQKGHLYIKCPVCGKKFETMKWSVASEEWREPCPAFPKEVKDEVYSALGRQARGLSLDGAGVKVEEDSQDAAMVDADVSGSGSAVGSSPRKSRRTVKTGTGV